jgi:hypothetical protein
MRAASGCPARDGSSGGSRVSLICSAPPEDVFLHIIPDFLRNEKRTKRCRVKAVIMSGEQETGRKSDLLIISLTITALWKYNV